MRPNPAHYRRRPNSTIIELSIVKIDENIQRQETKSVDRY